MPIVAKTTPPHLVKTKVEGTRLLTPLQQAVSDLAIVSEEDYQEADLILARIDRGLKEWDLKMEKILAPLRDAKAGADELKRDVRRPLEALRTSLVTDMREYKRQELAEQARAEAEAAAQLAEVNTELEAVATREAEAPTQSLRSRLARKREELEAQAETIIEESTPAPVQTDHSTVRSVKKWRMVDATAAMKAMMAQKIPAIFTLDTAAIQAHIRANGIESLAGWPGFVVEDDIIIASKPQRGNRDV